MEDVALDPQHGDDGHGLARHRRGAVQSGIARPDVTGTCSGSGFRIASLCASVTSITATIDPTAAPANVLTTNTASEPRLSKTSTIACTMFSSRASGRVTRKNTSQK